MALRSMGAKRTRKGTGNVSLAKQGEIASLLSTGTMTHADIAGAIGVDRQSVTRVNKKHREIIEQAHAALIERALPVSVERTLEEIETAAALQKTLTGKGLNSTILKTNSDISDYLRRVDKKEEMLMKSVGIAPSHAPSIHVQNIYNDNRGTILSPVVGQLLQGRMAEMTADVEDAEYEDMDE